jgi:hypothetical protein
MITSMLVPLLALAMQTPADLAKGSALYSECKSYISLIDKSRDIDTGGMLDAGICLGYISGVAEARMAAKNLCATSATTATMVRVYVAYMDKYPKLLDGPRWVGVGLALEDAYACPAK